MKSGDKVVCILPLTWEGKTYLFKGRIYTVQATMKCPGCGKLGLDVGINSPMAYLRCTKCGVKFHGGGIYWMDARRFVPLDWNDCREELIEQALMPEKQFEEIPLEKV